MFQEYIAKDRFIGEMKFDFLIANDTAKRWYDWEPNQFMPEREWCLSQIKPGFTIVDCGAHHGIMAVIFGLAIGKSGRVISYEPLHDNVDVIRRNAALNGLNNVEVRPFALGNEKRQVLAEVNSGNSMIRPTDQGEEVSVVRLDDDLDPSIKVDFLKVDVEGHDVEALLGMSRVIAQRPIIDLEIHNFLYADKDAALAKIKQMLRGYSFSIIPNIWDAAQPMQGFDIEYVKQFDNPHLLCAPKKPFWQRLFG